MRRAGKRRIEGLRTFLWPSRMWAVPQNPSAPLWFGCISPVFLRANNRLCLWWQATILITCLALSMHYSTLVWWENVLLMCLQRLFHKCQTGYNATKASLNGCLNAAKSFKNKATFNFFISKMYEGAFIKFYKFYYVFQGSLFVEKVGKRACEKCDKCVK